MKLPARVVIEDEVLRDGMQNEQRIFSVAEKLGIVRGLEEAGVTRIQVGSFVHPKWVPQMANTDEVFAALTRTEGVVYTALILNDKGLERARSAGVSHLSMSMSASESHNRKNANCSRDEAKVRVRDMVTHAKEAGITVRAGIQSAFGCAYDGAIDPAFVLGVVEMYRDLGADEVNLADSVGLANPKAVYEMTARAKDILGGKAEVSLHLHDTRGLGLANMVAGLEGGATVFDAALGGLGGCPFIPGATGNVATEDAVFALEEMGVATGIDWRRLAAMVPGIEQAVGRALPGRMAHLAGGACTSPAKN
ncbi:hydroxymethylglutaryl-CoA lyase [Shumkonia mesophila]|uniref:hydroxymethylglutaryl-CoA lyase n=1 Tax=Shumkonia mesophila TaxID=2838854 RepID=UPI002934802D|nr:hydroxymethylglutaryl-CoA lyase [Shumkonia mesophila]